MLETARAFPQALILLLELLVVIPQKITLCLSNLEPVLHLDQLVLEILLDVLIHQHLPGQSLIEFLDFFLGGDQIILKVVDMCILDLEVQP